MLLTRSPIETMPISFFPSNTGRWRTRFSVMRAEDGCIPMNRPSAWAGDLPEFLARVNRESCSGLRSRINGCVRSHSSCYRWRTHHFKACFHNVRSHQCPRQEDRREQACYGDETSVAWALAAASGRLFINVHDPHSIKIFEGQLSGSNRHSFVH